MFSMLASLLLVKNTIFYRARIKIKMLIIRIANKLMGCEVTSFDSTLGSELQT